MFLDYFLPCLGIALGVTAGIAIVSVGVIVLMIAALLIREVFEYIRDRLGEDR